MSYLKRFVALILLALTAAVTIAVTAPAANAAPDDPGRIHCC